ncbi:hypothetical protein FB474_2349 [Oryzihumus leptocrescens]|uniref:Secreted protein n=1 Tax=Oryzihumus leptocrescens TaxID=297536 RepID=A0A542ZKX4_9MICO|nr:hypothetical protein [Oryzihumus leptocrescens]TQL60949.1 hypothetical protein FB474_2349 [Oryzihumus leptocrescens]
MGTTATGTSWHRLRRRAVAVAAALSVAVALAVFAPGQAWAGPPPPSCTQSVDPPSKQGADVVATVHVDCDKVAASIWTWVTVEYFGGGSWHGGDRYAQSGTDHQTASATRSSKSVLCPGVLSTVTFRAVGRSRVNGHSIQRDTSPAVSLPC